MHEMAPIWGQIFKIQLLRGSHPPSDTPRINFVDDLDASCRLEPQTKTQKSTTDVLNQKLPKKWSFIAPYVHCRANSFWHRSKWDNDDMCPQINIHQYWLGHPNTCTEKENAQCLLDDPMKKTMFCGITNLQQGFIDPFTVFTKRKEKKKERKKNDTPRINFVDDLDASCRLEPQTKHKRAPLMYWIKNCQKNGALLHHMYIAELTVSDIAANGTMMTCVHRSTSINID